MMQEDSNGDFEIVDKKMATLLASDAAGSNNSALTNVAPPSALPSFLTSPLPPASHPPPTNVGSSIPAQTLVAGVPPPSGTIPPLTGSPPVGPPQSGLTPVGPPPIGPPRVGSPSVGPPPVGPQSVGPPPVGPPLSNFPQSGSLPRYPMQPGIASVSTIPPVASANSVPPNLVSGPPVSLSGAPMSTSPSPLIPSQQPVTSETQLPSFVPSVSSSPSPVASSLENAPSSGAVNVDSTVDLDSPGVGGDVGPGKPGWFGWIRGTVSNVGHKVAQKAKSSMDTMITTLDPQMKEFIHSGGDIDIVVASDKEVKVGAVREAFQFIFGKATVIGMAAQFDEVAAQPVGFEAALQSAEGRINTLRASGKVHPQQPVIAVENFIVELTPECWYDLGFLLLDDPSEDIILQMYTQVTPVPPHFITQLQAATPDDYPYKESGFATTVGRIASQSLQIDHTVWQETLTGVPRRDLIVLAARTLAGLYKSRLPRSYNLG